MNKQRYTVKLEDEPSEEDKGVIEAGLEAYNRLHAPDGHYQPMTVLLRWEDQRPVGGLLGETYWGWLHVSILWIHEELRGHGYGEQLLNIAEEEALRRGCHHAHLTTMSFQALSFYERKGYTVFGVLHDVPRGHDRYFLQKALSAVQARATEDNGAKGERS